MPAHELAVGNERLLQELEIDAAELTASAEALRQDGQTVVYVAVDGRAAGLLGIADPVKNPKRQTLFAICSRKASAW